MVRAINFSALFFSSYLFRKQKNKQTKKAVYYNLKFLIIKVTENFKTKMETLNIQYMAVLLNKAVNIRKRELALHIGGFQITNSPTKDEIM